MFEGFSPNTIDFLWGIRFNNNREWFREHKAEYEEYLYRPMLALAQEVRERVHLEGTVVKTARIYRDVRYSNGIPYKEHLWFSIRDDQVRWSEQPSMYFQIEPECGRAGFSFYAPGAQLMAVHRRRMLEKPEEFPDIMRKLLEEGSFEDRSVRYKRPKPGGTPASDPWYQLKNCEAEEVIPVGEELFSPNLGERLARIFEKVTPLYRYFRMLETLNPET